MVSDGRPSDVVTDEVFTTNLFGDDRISTLLSWRLRALEAAVDERHPRFACTMLGIGAEEQFQVLEDVSSSLSRASADTSTLDSSTIGSSLSSMATTMMSSVLETQTAASRSKRTLRAVDRESASAAASRRPDARRSAATPLDIALSFLAPRRRKRFVEEEVTVDVLDILDDVDVADLLDDDAGAVAKFRERYPGPDADPAERPADHADPAAFSEEDEAPEAVDEAAAPSTAPAGRSAPILNGDGQLIDKFGRPVDAQGRVLDGGALVAAPRDNWEGPLAWIRRDPDWQLTDEPVKQRLVWNKTTFERVALEKPVLIAKRRKIFELGAERLAYMGMLVDPDDGSVVADLVFKESRYAPASLVRARGSQRRRGAEVDGPVLRYEEEHTVVKRATRANDDDDGEDDGFFASISSRMRSSSPRAKKTTASDEVLEASLFHRSFCASQADATALALKFNEKISRWTRLPRVTYIEPHIYEFTLAVVQPTGTGYETTYETTRLLGEALLTPAGKPGEDEPLKFTKFNNNAGRVVAEKNFKQSTVDCGPVVEAAPKRSASPRSSGFGAMLGIGAVIEEDEEEESSDDEEPERFVVGDVMPAFSHFSFLDRAALAFVMPVLVAKRTAPGSRRRQSQRSSPRRSFKRTTPAVQRRRDQPRRFSSLQASSAL